MTLIIALTGKDGIVLAADSRGTIGDPRGLTAISDDHTKIFKLSNFCGIGISGSSELAAKFVLELKKVIDTKNLEDVEDILIEARSLARTSYDDWFSKFKIQERPVLLLTIVGFHKKPDNSLEARIYMLASPLDFAPQLFPTGNCLSGIPQYAVYLLHRFYDPGMTVGNLTQLAAYLIMETATQDPKVGGPVKIAKITTDNGFIELKHHEIEKIIELNNEQNEKLKQFFLKGTVNERNKHGKK